MPRVLPSPHIGVRLHFSNTEEKRVVCSFRGVARFLGNMSKYQPNGKLLAVNDPILATVLLIGSSIDDSQRIPSCSPAWSTNKIIHRGKIIK